MTYDLTSGSPPNFLIVPGLNNSGALHWQTLWQHLLRNSSRTELGDWAHPGKTEQSIDELKIPMSGRRSGEGQSKKMGKATLAPNPVRQDPAKETERPHQGAGTNQKP